ncbi:MULTISPECIES: bifunctional DNA-formamidopyrimidine glycosylase/DNA-(apurinic or apyrimidinic site) lyase [unclassified Solwaraspora]|uniref:bifunctional DNA-formamidopyrimidine glycosylase/DNA-(apurinic or apyrimidinic site) lyase n=1 Tax=unclassified Solwaraspora TaxID=2627926 RepID=UPI00248D1609|nr:MULTISPECIES: bifunctional DNA-formamidopyrimidine glycosylase/DNA-(apurinic or apyrimidinic site) lyase [unclassified Solwaraspora]WBB98490.1 bifunctional DNA-formamidopyrimidine glycosylase/DNA-(apurinic or apyrimidinic site) lyase [Solwaraspora sp. WMMA2059]WBC22957.1 bifunctional DNA-formamidopyrimidine glycosylase/DNA-(apurinic or apyrimidinic site) lyase [Solwaraspora sp. WMMA2080]WJK35003.1 bifunctional DNA-formamidopyrimidine glycosylase/DNA-(apurinic or apyrimidinic site) lyase [Solw
MPELPEVETVRQGLAGWVIGRRLDSVQVHHPRAIRRHLPGPVHFAAVLSGRQIRDVRRRGKYLWLPLDSGDAIVGHLGMSGQLLLQPAHAPDETHLRVRFRFAEGDPELRFVDQRTFGGLAVSPGGAELPAEIAHIARDPLDPDFSDAAFVAAVRRRRTEIKRALLDQSLISGIGNIYADEALWRAGLHGTRPTDRLPAATVTRLLAHVRDVLRAAVTEGGTSFDALYVNVNGQSGYFDRSLNVYGREDQPCTRCGALIRRESFMNRSSFSCPRCQPRPRAVRR